MRIKKATHRNSQPEHNQYGIYNWFAKKGITDKEVMQGAIHSFCEENGFDMKGFAFTKQRERTVFNWVANRFQKFAADTGEYLKENNYL